MKYKGNWTSFELTGSLFYPSSSYRGSTIDKERIHSAPEYTRDKVNFI